MINKKSTYAFSSDFKKNLRPVTLRFRPVAADFGAGKRYRGAAVGGVLIFPVMAVSGRSSIVLVV